VPRKQTQDPDPASYFLSGTDVLTAALERTRLPRVQGGSWSKTPRGSAQTGNPGNERTMGHDVITAALKKTSHPRAQGGSWSKTPRMHQTWSKAGYMVSNRGLLDAESRLYGHNVNFSSFARKATGKTTTKGFGSTCSRFRPISQNGAFLTRKEVTESRRRLHCKMGNITETARAGSTPKSGIGRPSRNQSHLTYTLGKAKSDVVPPAHVVQLDEIQAACP